MRDKRIHWATKEISFEGVPACEYSVIYDPKHRNISISIPSLSEEDTKKLEELVANMKVYEFPAVS